MTGPSAALRMRIELEPSVVGEPSWPDGIVVRTFTDDHASALYALLTHGYRHGGGAVAPFETWLRQMTGDNEFDANLWFLAESEYESTLVGAALCWTSAFVKDLVVHESWRRRGLGEALLRHVYKAFSARGAATVELKVESTNAAAIRLYERAGMCVVERLS